MQEVLDHNIDVSLIENLLYRSFHQDDESAMAKPDRGFMANKVHYKDDEQAQLPETTSKRLRPEVGISLISDRSISKGRKLRGTLAGKQAKEWGDRDRCC